MHALRPATAGRRQTKAFHEGRSVPDKCAPVLICIDGSNQEVECAGNFLHGLCFAAVDEVVGAKGAGFLFFARRKWRKR